MTPDVITLYKQSSAHGVLEAVTETQRDVLINRDEVDMRETYAAHSAGLSPEVAFKLTCAKDYEGEKKLLWDDVLYRVIRTQPKGSGIMLICGRWNNDA